MGQKVNPHGIRVGVIKDWDSRWFTSKKEFGDTLVEDYKIRRTLKKQLYAAGVPKIEIERSVDAKDGSPRLRVNIYCAKPGMVIYTTYQTAVVTPDAALCEKLKEKA